jgi:DNA-binding transcriptional regulator of glucitol operon
MSVVLLIVAVVAGWMVQMYLTFRQSMAFNKEVAAMRDQGTVSVGVAGKRYRGGRAYVAITIDDAGVVRGALTLSGFTTFSRARPLVGLLNLKARRILADQPLPGLSRQQHEAARQAVGLAKSRVPV